MIPASASGLRHGHVLDAAGLLRLADAGDRGVAGWLPGRLYADHRRELDLQPGRLAAAELLADLDGVVLALDADDNADVGPPERGRQQRRQLAVEVVDRLHAGQDEVDLLAREPRRQRRRPGVAVDPPIPQTRQVDGPVGALGQRGVEAELDVGIAEADHDDLAATRLLDEEGLLHRLVVPLGQDELEELPVDVGPVVVELELLDEVRRLLDGNHDAHGRALSARQLMKSEVGTDAGEVVGVRAGRESPGTAPTGR